MRFVISCENIPEYMVVPLYFLNIYRKLHVDFLNLMILLKFLKIYGSSSNCGMLYVFIYNLLERRRNLLDANRRSDLHLNTGSSDKDLQKLN